MLSSNQSQIIEEAKFTYSPLKKALEKQTEKQVDALKILNLSNERDALKKISGIFSKKEMNDLITYELKKNIHSQEIIK